MSDLRQMYLAEQNDEPTYGCPDHPDYCMAAIVQQVRQEPVTITKNKLGFDIETSPFAAFVHDMTTETTIAYTCGNPECGFSVSPEQLGELKERHGSRQLGY